MVHSKIGKILIDRLAVSVLPKRKMPADTFDLSNRTQPRVWEILHRAPAEPDKNQDYAPDIRGVFSKGYTNPRVLLW